MYYVKKEKISGQMRGEAELKWERFEITLTFRTTNYNTLRVLFIDLLKDCQITVWVSHRIF